MNRRTFLKLQRKIFCCDGNEQTKWFRIFGYGIMVTKREPLFSERYGYEKFYSLMFGWRIKFIYPPPPLPF